MSIVYIRVKSLHFFDVRGACACPPIATGSPSCGGQPFCNSSGRAWHFIERIFADAAYQGPKTVAAIAKTGTWKLAIVKRNELHRFLVLPKRWIVERTLAWISRNRRLARDFERYAQSTAAFIRLAMIRIMLRRLTRPTLCS